MRKNSKLLYISLLICTFVLGTQGLCAQDARFVLVLDAGHGGHDAGALGAVSREKDINLGVTLKVGALVEQHFRDEIKVVFSRKTDRFLTLQERADVVNNNHADLFICIHTNSSPSSAAFGAESYTLGLAKTKSNLDVAMRENSVITLEDNYKARYQGFDPKSTDSYIMFEFMQDKYIDRSLDFASDVQKQFKSYCNRLDRGVRQAGFWVLHRSACPSVLVELGFISNPVEERFLNSEDGQRDMAAAIFNAIVDYKRVHDKKSGRSISPVAKIDISHTSPSQYPANSTQQAHDIPVRNSVDEHPETANAVVRATDKNTDTIVPTQKKDYPRSEQSTVPVFKVQFLASVKELRPGDPQFKGLTNVSFYSENGMFKYTVGNESDYQSADKIRKNISNLFPHAFIVAFRANQKLSARETAAVRKK